jgi:HEPN domain-containing protein
MPNRYRDWLRQAEADLKLARVAMGAESFEWACFAAHQAAEKALKAVFLHKGEEAWGHSVAGLLGELGDAEEVAAELTLAGKSLDKHYIPARYPNGLPAGAPADAYTREEAQRALGDAEAILGLCRRLVAGSD